MDVAENVAAVPTLCVRGHTATGTMGVASINTVGAVQTLMLRA